MTINCKYYTTSVQSFMQYTYYIHFNLQDSVSLSKFTYLVLPSTNLSGLLCIQNLDTAQKMGCFGLAEPLGRMNHEPWQDASEHNAWCAFQEPALSFEDYSFSYCLCCKCSYTAVVLNKQGKELGQLIMEGFLWDHISPVLITKGSSFLVVSLWKYLI